MDIIHEVKPLLYQWIYGSYLTICVHARISLLFCQETALAIIKTLTSTANLVFLKNSGKDSLTGTNTGQNTLENFPKCQTPASQACFSLYELQVNYSVSTGSLETWIVIFIINLREGELAGTYIYLLWLYTQNDYVFIVKHFLCGLTYHTIQVTSFCTSVNQSSWHETISDLSLTIKG